MESRASLKPQTARRDSSPESAGKPAARPSPRPREIPTSTPKYKSLACVRDPKVRRAKEYLQHLLILRDLFPEYSAGIDTQIAYARTQADRTPVSDRDRVLKVLEHGPATCADVAGDLSMPYATTYKILKEFLESGIAIGTERKGISANKPYIVYSTTSQR